ncbi:MAG: hypothetical protein KKC64_07170 [Spirochaetes bacterium]|nr:hypothetical protein [Spirochaetota bacterium]
MIEESGQINSRGQIHLPKSWPLERMQQEAREYYLTWSEKYVQERNLPKGEGRQLFVDYLAGQRESPAFTWGDRRALTVSEAHGYGMLAVCGMAAIDQEYKTESARADFDALARLFLSFPSKGDKRLMTWQLFGDGIDPATGKGNSNTIQPGQRQFSATDGDMDIAYSFLLADSLWPGQGLEGSSYREMALEVISGLRESCTNTAGTVLYIGDWAGSGSSHSTVTRSSDFMPAHLSAFAAADTAHSAHWETLREAQISLVFATNAGPAENSGLVPDFFKSYNKATGFEPARTQVLESPHDGDYNWNACRVPWRLGATWLAEADPRLEKILHEGTVMIRKLSGGDPSRIPPGQYLSSGPVSQPIPGRNYSDYSFTAPWALAAACTAGAELWTEALLDELGSWRTEGLSSYFGDSIRLLVYLTLAGAYGHLDD